MMVMRAAPNVAGAQSEDAEKPHADARRPRPGQNGMVLLIVVNDEEPEEEKAAEHTADRLGREIEIPVRPGQRDQNQAGGGENMPPTFHSGVLCVPLCSKDQLTAAFGCLFQ